MKERPQVNIRLERGLLDELDRLAALEHVDRSDMARRLLGVGITNYRGDMAMREHRKGNVSAWRAAEMAGVSLYEMLDRIREEGIPYELDPEVLERLGERVGQASAVRESRAPYQPGATDAEMGIAELRGQFRPNKVTTLFVGESSPAGGTHFYRANSNLFRATREAFALAFGEEEVLSGPRFLHYFRDHGSWLVDLADRPVNQLPEDQRQAGVEKGIGRLAEVIRQTKPDRIVAVKATIGRAVREAARLSGFTGELVELPFPVRQWRARYVDLLASTLGGQPSTRPKEKGMRTHGRTSHGSSMVPPFTSRSSGTTTARRRPGRSTAPR